MTEQEFVDYLKLGHEFADKLNRGTSIAFVILGIHFIVLTDATFILIPGGFLIAAGVYTFITIDNDYKVNIIETDTSKATIIDCLKNRIESRIPIEEYEDGELVILIYQNRFFVKVQVTLYFGDRLILFNATSKDMHSIKGAWDFGVGRRAMKKIENVLQQYLRKHAESR